jgi:hypothetical protein
MMKKIFGIIVLILLLSVTSKADDISDFEIEGMSINDTLLQFYNKEEISKTKVNLGYKDNKYTAVAIVDDKYKTYAQVDIEYLTQDKNILIKALSGVIYYSDMNKCYEKMDDITKEISNVVSVIPKTNTYKHDADPSGSVRGTMYQLENGQIIYSVLRPFIK